MQRVKRNNKDARFEKRKQISHSANMNTWSAPSCENLAHWKAQLYLGRFEFWPVTGKLECLQQTERSKEAQIWHHEIEAYGPQTSIIYSSYKIMINEPWLIINSALWLYVAHVGQAELISQS